MFEPYLHTRMFRKVQKHFCPAFFFSMSGCICHSKINVVLPFFFLRFLKLNHQHLHLLKGREKHSRSQCVFICFFILIFVVCCFLGGRWVTVYFPPPLFVHIALLHRNNMSVTNIWLKIKIEYLFSAYFCAIHF